MKRIATANVAADLFGPGKNGFRAAVPGVSDPTYLAALWFNHMQEAIVRTIEQAGLALSDTDYDQFVNALNTIYPRLSNAAFTVSPTAPTPAQLDNSQKLAPTAFVQQSLAYPLNALQFPTIANASNTIAVTSAIVAGQGGSVAIPAGILVSLAQVLTAGATGVMASFSTQAWASASLAINSTYYLRAQVVAGVLTFYVQQGTDTDAIPAGLLGTPNAAVGGGFDSTVLDMLVAKVVTGAAGTAPTVTPLKNKATLVAFYSGAVNSADTVIVNNSMDMGGSVVMTLNWARTPTIDHISRISDGSNLSWAGGLSTDVFSVKGDVAAMSGLPMVFDKTYIRNRYQSKIPIVVSLGGSVATTAAWYKFEVLVRE